MRRINLRTKLVLTRRAPLKVMALLVTLGLLAACTTSTPTAVRTVYEGTYTQTVTQTQTRYGSPTPEVPTPSKTVSTSLPSAFPGCSRTKSVPRGSRLTADKIATVHIDTASFSQAVGYGFSADFPILSKTDCGFVATPAIGGHSVAGTNFWYSSQLISKQGLYCSDDGCGEDANSEVYTVNVYQYTESTPAQAIADALPKGCVKDSGQVLSGLPATDCMETPQNDQTETYVIARPSLVKGKPGFIYIVSANGQEANDFTSSVMVS